MMMAMVMMMMMMMMMMMVMMIEIHIGDSIMYIPCPATIAPMRRQPRSRRGSFCSSQ